MICSPLWFIPPSDLIQSRFINAAAFVNASFLFMADILLYKSTTCCLSFSHWPDLGCCLLFGYGKEWCCEHQGTCFYLNICYISGYEHRNGISGSCDRQFCSTAEKLSKPFHGKSSPQLVTLTIATSGGMKLYVWWFFICISLKNT